VADWRKIKTEYITTDTSYRKLGLKYGVHYQTICRRAKEEGWIEQREHHENKVVTKTLDKISEKQSSSAELMQDTANALLQMIADGIEKFDTDTLLADRQALRGITGALKDLKDVLSLKSDADLEEQKARIAKLRKEAEEGDAAPPEIKVSIVGGADEYAK
jgi:cob(I)alamin adenosyltransferase